MSCAFYKIFWAVRACSSTRLEFVQSSSLAVDDDTRKRINRCCLSFPSAIVSPEGTRRARHVGSWPRPPRMRDIGTVMPSARNRKRR